MPRVTRSITTAVKRQTLVLGSTVSTVWAGSVANLAAGGVLFDYGIHPRTQRGLLGIVVAPFLHADLTHLLSNTVPLVVLGWLILLLDRRHFVPVTGLSMLGSGLMAWLLGNAGSVHVGASGVVFGYLGFLLLAGWYARRVGAMLLSIVVASVWGGLVVGVLPGQPGISWQGHLGGFAAGVLAARWLAPRRR